MAGYRSGDGRTVELGRVLSQGGEGFIHEIPAMPALVAKIWREPDERQARKLDVLLRHAPVLPDHVRARVELAWPSEALYDEQNVARGYLMPRVPTDQYHELVRFCIPAARRDLEQERGSAFTKTELLTMARNVAEVFRILHVMGYLIGDVNHTNFLVRNDGKVFVIDLDSIQARDPDTGEVHRCTVGKEDFTPPRLMGQRFEDVDRTPDDDMFGLAVLAFQLLMDGNHPFDPVDQTGEEGQVRQSNIRRAHSPYTAIDPVQARAILDLDMISDTGVRERTRQNMLALMGVEATADFSTVIGPRISLWLQLESYFQDMFRRAFEGSGGGRPLSSEWVQALEDAGATILQPAAVSPQPPTAPRPTVRPATPAQPSQPAPQPTQTPAQPQTRPGGRPATRSQTRPGGRPATPAQPSQPAAQTPARPTTTRPTSQPQTRPGGRPATRPTSPRAGSPPGAPPSQPPSTSQGGGGRRRSRWWFYLGIPLGLALLAGLGAFMLFSEEISDIFEPPREPRVIRIPLAATPTAVITPTPTRTPEVARIVVPAPTSTPTPIPTVAPTPMPTTMPTPSPTAVPDVVMPSLTEIFIEVEEDSLIQRSFAWDHDLHGSAGAPIKLSEDRASVWFSPVSHSDWEATITIGADDDSFTGDGSAEILITNDSGSIEYLLYVTVLDAGEYTSPPITPPTITPIPTPTPIPTVYESIHESGEMLIQEDGDDVTHTFEWDHAAHGDAMVVDIVSGSPGSIWSHSDISHSARSATITVGVSDDGRAGNYQAEIVISNASGSMVYTLTVSVINTTGATQPSTETGRIAFSSDRDGDFEIYVMNADGSDVNRLTDNQAYDVAFNWSSDGRRIAFHSDRDGDFETYVMNADGSDVNRLPSDQGEDWFLNRSPDGRRIAFESDQDGNWEIYVMNADGSNVNRLTDNPADDWDPAWSPDGRRIAFSSDREGDLEIYVMNADGSDVNRLTDSQAWKSSPAWSPDGRRIAFESDQDGNQEIYVMNADGSDVNRLTDNSADDVEPKWSPASNAKQATAVSFILTPVSIPTPAAMSFPSPTATPVVTPTFTFVSTPPPTAIPLPNLVLERFEMCVEGMRCWPKSEGEAGVSGSLRVSVTWRVANRGGGPTESPTDLRLYADGQYHYGEYLMGRDAFIIPILGPGESVRVENLTKKNPDDFWPISFSLIGHNTVIAVVDIEDRVEEGDDNCGNMKRFKDRSSAMKSECDNVAYRSELVFLPTPIPTPTPLPTAAN